MNIQLDRKVNREMTANEKVQMEAISQEAKDRYARADKKVVSEEKGVTIYAITPAETRAIIVTRYENALINIEVIGLRAIQKMIDREENTREKTVA